MNITAYNRAPKKNKKFTGIALAVALTAGTSIALAAGPDTKKSDTKNTMHNGHSHTMSEHMDSDHQVHDATAWLSFVRADTLMGVRVIGSDDNTIGTINDFVVDRGTGRIAYAIIGHGGILTLGQDVFAVKYDRLNYFPVDENFEIGMTEMQANRQVEFLPENWKNLNHSDWMTELKDFVSSEDTYRYGDTTMTDADTTTVKGTVTKLNRQEYERNEDVVLTITGNDGNTSKVVLGPSWYVMGNENAPSVNDRVEIKAFEHDGRWIATEAMIAGKELKLRDTDGHVLWKTQSKKTPRFVMLSDLKGKNIEVGGTTGGEVDDTIIETSSGRVAFFAFDPNENLFGLADDLSLVPWGAVQIASDTTLWSDISDDQFEHALPMPENLETMRTKRSISSAYARFSMETPNFESSTRSNYTNGDSEQWDRSGDAWGKGSKLTKTFAEGKKRQVQGDFINYDTVELQNGAITASSMWIKTDDGKRQVILGPDWYFQNQDLEIEWGDMVKVMGRVATIDGETFVAAWKIEHNSSSWTLWNDSTPAWVD